MYALVVMPHGICGIALARLIRMLAVGCWSCASFASLRASTGRLARRR